MVRQKLTAEQLAQIHARAVAGEPIKRMAREYGVAGSSLLSLLWRRYQLRSNAQHRFTPEEAEELYRRASAGVSVRQLAAETGASWSGVMRLLKARFDFKPTGRWSPTLILPQDVAVLAYMAGLVDADGSIPFLNKHWCVKVGMTYEPVIRWLHQFGGIVEMEILPPPRKRLFTWSVHRHRDVETLLRAIAPYLIVKRARAEEVLAAFAEADALVS